MTQIRPIYGGVVPSLVSADGDVAWWAGPWRVHTFRLLLESDVRLRAPRGAVPGSWYVLLVVQDAAGGHAVTWSELGYRFAGAAPPALATAANATTVLQFAADGDGVLHHMATCANSQATPNAPTSLAAVDGSGRVDLTWTNGSAIATGFRVERFDPGFADWFTVDDVVVPSTAYTDVIEPGTYQYRVRALAGGAQSEPSNTDEGTSIP
jgi:hypothetical protein